MKLLIAILRVFSIFIWMGLSVVITPFNYKFYMNIFDKLTNFDKEVWYEIKETKRERK